MSLVLDASVVMAWVLDETTQAVAAGVMQRVAREGGVVPSLWRLESANAMRSAVRRKRMTLDQRDRALAILRGWPIDVDGETDLRAWSGTLRLADRFGLTPYDAAYLELADRRGLPLATLDSELVRAALAAGVPLCA